MKFVIEMNRVFNLLSLILDTYRAFVLIIGTLHWRIWVSVKEHDLLFMKNQKGI